MNCGCFLECILQLLGSKYRSELMSEFVRNVRMSEWIHETSQFERKFDHKIRVNSGNEWIRPKCEDVQLNANSLLHPTPLTYIFRHLYFGTCIFDAVRILTCFSKPIFLTPIFSTPKVSTPIVDIYIFWNLHFLHVHFAMNIGIKQYTRQNYWCRKCRCQQYSYQKI